MIAYCYSQNLERCCDLLPSNLGRSSLIHRLASAYKLLSHSDVALLKVRPASRDDLLAYHTSPFLDVLLSDHNETCSVKHESTYGLEYDCPCFPGLPSYVLNVAGASIAAAKALVQEHSKINIAVNWDGGRHHAKKSAASGFCYVQDVVLAIQELRKTCSRVLYIDLDLHHGDGVESAFIHSDKVLTLSIHRHSPGFFPNSGSFEEMGKGKGRGYALNVPLQRGLSDASFNALVHSVVLPTIEAYIDPAECHAVVIQCGVDGLAFDPCNEWNLSIAGYCSAIAKIQDKAALLKCKALYLGGGGYHKTLASRCYAALLATLLDVKLGDIPEHSLWHEYQDTNHELAISETMTSMIDENIDDMNKLIKRIGARIDVIKKQCQPHWSEINPSTLPIGNNPSPVAPIQFDWQDLDVAELEGKIVHPVGSLVSNVLIMMHGFGDNAKSFEHLARSLNLPETIAISIQGPYRVPFVADQETISCMWANDVNFEGGLVNDEGDFTRATQLIHGLLDNINQRGISNERIIFFGYGQGAMLALQSAADYGCNVIAIGGTLNKQPGLNKGRHALVCGGDRGSKITKKSLTRIHSRFAHVSCLRWPQSGDRLPKAVKRNSWIPIMEFLSKNIVQMRGIPKGAVLID